ncbi:hypothetical protein [Chitinophaga filiformis]|uniref:Uncharacterized protein n=1 Tax=Chitinophaga filiformis TaxID=104663 RepID=A0A1G7Z286_CHIFI|nr:hypothetical protein [Chitinophaga filiformis]SDH02606.1 hypothetical protein SAMN04488121_10893 [Chitinophaga filiformis]
MKTFSLMTWGGLCIAALTFVSCSKEAKLQSNNRIAAAAAEADGDGAMLAKLLRANGPQYEFFKVDGKQGGRIKTKQGSIYTFSPNSLVTQSGGPVSGSVDIVIKEILTPSNMIFASRPTATNGGAQLTSYGEFFVRATQAGQDLKLRADSAVAVQVPVVKRPAQDGVPLWGGDTSVIISTSGYNDSNQPVTIPVAASGNQGVSWNPAPGFALFNGTTLNFRLDSLMAWRNCDALTNLPGPKTTILGYFTNFYNPATQTSYGGEEPSMLFFKPAGVNTVVKLYNVILNAPVGRQGLLSYQNSVPIGQAGTFLAITALNGNFFAQKLPVNIPAPPGGQNYAAISFNLAPVTPAALVALIQSMDTP